MPTFLELPLPCASAGGKRTQLMQAVDVSSSAEDIPIKQLSPNTLGQIDGGKTDVQEHLGRTIFCTTKPSPLSSMGGGRCAARRICLRRQTTATRWRRPLPAGLLWPANARCNGAPLSKTKVKADLPRASVSAALAISSPSSRKVTPCHHPPRTKTFRSNN